MAISSNDIFSSEDAWIGTQENGVSQLLLGTLCSNVNFGFLMLPPVVQPQVGGDAVQRISGDESRDESLVPAAERTLHSGHTQTETDAGSEVKKLPRKALLLLRRHWQAIGVSVVMAYAAGLSWQLSHGAEAIGIQTVGDWMAAALFHLPYGLILLLLGFGMWERLGYFWNGKQRPVQGKLPSQQPTVCIQLPMFNEQAVAQRVIEAAASVRWPRDRLLVQVLDDSTDVQTRELVAAACAQMRLDHGVNIVCIHRTNRSGYKAGALENGRKQTDAEYIAIFDADFLPPADYLERALPYFYDADGSALSGLALVQAQWGHLNDDESALTAAQALWVDDHHTLQMSWRSANLDFVNFTGTAGVWRALAIEAVGGWRSASLVEDCELSVRALLAGWRTRFIRHLAVPAELPQTMEAYRSQQKRWTQGWAQLQRLHLGALLGHYKTPAWRKLVLLYLICISWQWPLWMLWIAVLPFLMANGLWLGAMGAGWAVAAYLLPPLLFALFSATAATVQTRHGQGSTKGGLTRRCARIVPFLVINTGMLPHHFCAFLEGLFGPLHSEFERTPKTASQGFAAAAQTANAASGKSQPSRRRWPYLWVELAFAAFQLVWLWFFVQQGLALAVIGSAWVLGCLLMLRLAPSLAQRMSTREAV